MRRYIFRRLANTLITLFFIIATNFFLFRLMPGAPIKTMARSQKLSASMVKYLENLYGLDKSLFEQFLIYIKNCLTFDMGTSFKFHTEVTPLLIERMGNTLVLVLASTILAIVLGVLAGLWAGWKRGKPIDLTLLGTSLFFWSMPTFWICMIFMALFAGILPIGGMRDLQLENPTRWVAFLDLLKHITLPTVVMTITYMGQNLLITRNEVTNILTQDYIATARAKGLSRWRITFKHVLRNASLPLLSSAALSIAFIMSGALQTEIIFSWPGIGRLLYEATLTRDYPVLQGSFYLLSLAVLFANLITDIAYKYIDPRVEY
ncbi:ABC transporter permease [bacterium]|nr:ABC transporter permease [bacterium]